MKRMNANELLALYGRAEANQKPMWSLWEELALYIQPSKAGFITAPQDGDKRTQKLYDSTGPQANDDLAHYLAAGLTPSASPWLQIVFRDEELAKNDAYNEWLQACNEILRAEFIRSNFYEVMGEVYADLPTFGVGSVQATERRDFGKRFIGLHFESIWIKEIVALANQYGELDTTFRCYEQTALQWLQMFGEALPRQARQMADQAPESKLKFIHAVYPRDPADIDQQGAEMGKADAKKMPFASVWVSMTDKEIVRESGYLELPRHIAVWSKTSGSIWGYGPGMLALPDIRTVNEATRLEMLAWEKSIDRPMKTVQNNIVGSLDLGAGGLTTVRDMNGIAPLFDATDFNLTAVKINDLRTAILKTFFADLIREPGQDTGAQTAYEVAKRLERAQRILGEAVGHLRGMLRWAAERSFKILMREGQFPPVPEGLLQASPQIDVRYTSPLQAAQESQGIEQTTLFLGDIAQLAQINPTVMDWVDWDGMVTELAKRRSVPATGLNSKEQVEAIRADRAQQQAAAAQQQTALNAGQVVRDVGAGAGKEQALRLVQGGT